MRTEEGKRRGTVIWRRETGDGQKLQLGIESVAKLEG